MKVKYHLDLSKKEMTKIEKKYGSFATAQHVPLNLTVTVEGTPENTRPVISLLKRHYRLW